MKCLKCWGISCDTWARSEFVFKFRFITVCWNKFVGYLPKFEKALQRGWQRVFAKVAFKIYAKGKTLWKMYKTFFTRIFRLISLISSYFLLCYLNVCLPFWLSLQSVVDFLVFYPSDLKRKVFNKLSSYFWVL